MTSPLGTADTWFVSLVTNAMDFTTQAVRDLPRKPKYSAIHFYAAIELFLKARLLKEHWSLVVDDPGKANVTSFHSGNFRSANLKDSAERLANVLQQPLKEHEFEAFKKLGEERNKLVHFVDTTKVNPKAIETLIFKELTAWHHMYRLLTKTWNPHFEGFKKQLERLNKTVRKKLPQYAKAKFAAILPEIEIEKKKKVEFNECSVCGFEAARVTKEHKELFSQTCLVCEPDWSENFLRLKCSCGEKVDYYCEVEICPKCEHTFEADNLVSLFAPNYPPDDPDLHVAFCNICESETVIEWGGRWLCVNCVTLHEEPSLCGYCTSLITGTTEDTSLTGCFMCDGPSYPD